MTTTTIDPTITDCCPRVVAVEDPGVVGRRSDKGTVALPEPGGERPMPALRARLRSDLCI